MTFDTNSMKHTPDSISRRGFNWELIRGIGQSPLATFSIAMPFIGYAILYHSDLKDYLGNLGGLLEIQEQKLISDVSSDARSSNENMDLYTKLNLIYLGSFSIGAGTIAYRLCAPSTIKEYGSISLFVESELSRATARKLRVLVIAIKARRPKVAASLNSIAPWLEREHCKLKVASNELRGMKDDQLQIDVLSSFYNVESRYRARLAVYVTTILYCLGFFLVSIPGLAFTFRVLKVITLQIVGPSA